jgi:hypothetical protein
MIYLYKKVPQTYPYWHKLCQTEQPFASSSLFQQKWQFSTVDRYEMVRASTSSTVVAFVEYLSFSAIHTL